MSQLIQASFSISYEYPVHFTTGIFDPGNTLLANTLLARSSSPAPKVLFVLDQNVVRSNIALPSSIRRYFAAYTNRLKLIPKFIELRGGEALKNSLESLSAIYTTIQQENICRHCYVVALGGGALLDLAGFAASTAHRGIRHLRLPTTVLAQNDAGVGVKNGVNHLGKKNFIGTFSPPFAVINDADFLVTLPLREKRSGYAEAVKVALINDREFFEAIELNRNKLILFDRDCVTDLVRRCAEAHVRHITTSGDPFEHGSARPLDFGHWAAHKLEQLSEFRIHHGEAVAVGIAIDTVYSHLANSLSAESTERILVLLESLGFELWVEELAAKDPLGNLRVLEGIEEFREHLGGNLSITLLKAIGHRFEAKELDREKVTAAIKRLGERYARQKK